MVNQILPQPYYEMLFRMKKKIYMKAPADPLQNKKKKSTVSFFLKK